MLELLRITHFDVGDSHLEGVHSSQMSIGFVLRNLLRRFLFNPRKIGGGDRPSTDYLRVRKSGESAADR